MDASRTPHHVAGRPRNLVRAPETALIAVVCLAAIMALAVTAAWPAVDVVLARAALLPAHATVRPALSVLREVFRATPYLLFCATAIFLAVQARRGRLRPTVAWRRLMFVALTLAIGPGLAVNAGLKAYSHRPRPIQTVEAGDGGMPFRPFFRFDGACASNCSFSSGEAASAFWTSAPALLAPPPYRLVATAAALSYGVIVSALRMALGAHFLSDVAFSALFVLALTLFMRRLMRPT